jgi:hypothetical protein
MKWKFSHNNEPEIVVEADSEREAVRAGLVAKGLTSTTHPVRAWPVGDDAPAAGPVPAKKAEAP